MGNSVVRYQELPPRLRQVALLVAEGKSNKEIGEALKIQPGTVRNHVHRLSGLVLDGRSDQGQNVRVRIVRWLFLDHEFCLECQERDAAQKMLREEIRRLEGRIKVLSGDGDGYGDTE